MTAAPPRYPRYLFALGVVGATLQVARASSWLDHDAFMASLVLSWLPALALAYGRSHLAPSARPSERFAGVVVALVAASAFAGLRDYHGVARVLPVVTGIGLAIAWSGVRGVRGFARELILLSLPLIHPLPVLIRDAVMPTEQTAALATAYLRAFTVQVERDGTRLLLPGATLTVLDACSGLVVMTQLLVLGILVVTLIPMRRGHQAFVLASAIAVGFVVNAARIALLAVVASRVPNDERYFRRYEAATVVFPVVAAALACTVWWWVLSKRTVPHAGAADRARGAAR